MCGQPFRFGCTQMPRHGGDGVSPLGQEWRRGQDVIAPLQFFTFAAPRLIASASRSPRSTARTRTSLLAEFSIRRKTGAFVVTHLRPTLRVALERDEMSVVNDARSRMASPKV